MVYLDLGGAVGHTHLDLFLRLGGAISQALFQGLHGRGHDECVATIQIAILHILDSLDVNVEDADLTLLSHLRKGMGGRKQTKVHVGLGGGVVGVVAAVQRCRCVQSTTSSTALILVP